MRGPKKVDPARISQHVKSGMLKDNQGKYQKQQEGTEGEGDARDDVKLVSKDQELNFSGKVEDEDELEVRGGGVGMMENKNNNDIEEGINLDGKNQQEEQKAFFH